MSLLPHWGDCQKEIDRLKLLLQEYQDMNVAYMRDIGELTCRLRLAALRKPDCQDCDKKDVKDTIE